MKLLKYSIVLVAALLMWGCSSDELAAPGNDGNDNGDGTFTLSASLAIPRMATAESRAMGADPQYDNLRLYLVEFERYGADALSNPISNVYMAEEETPEADRVVFKVTLNKSDQPRVLHLIAVPKDVELSFTDWGMEGTVIPALTTSAGNEAYWQRVEFPDGYGQEVNDVWQTPQNVKEKLQNVPMIRNFAQVSVTVTPEAQQNFVLTGFALTNTPTAGTVAPWNSTDMLFPAYTDGAGNQLSYPEIAYDGLIPGSAQIIDPSPSAAQCTPEPKFIYERPFSSVSHTQVIIAGRYRGGAESYYKIDLGSLENGVFEIYNILRNFNYIVRINGVSASGYSTVEGALQGVVFNNISFDVQTQQMLNISDGTDMLWVNFTTAVVTQNTDASRTIRFAYRYRKNISSGSGTVDNGAATVIDLKPGDVIESVEELTSPSDSTDWRFYQIKTFAPTSEQKTQEFVVVNNESGLGRRIQLILREPWEVTRNRVFAGNYNLPSQFPTDTNYENVVGDGAQAPLTVFFTIPDNLPRAIFPLSFVLEADRQNIENNPVGTLVVTSGTSSFPNVQGSRIKYVKTITWTDYNTDLDADHPTGVIVPDQNNPDVKIRRVRCRFRTITSLENLGETGSRTTIVRIHNPYFTTPKDVDGNRENGGNIEVSFTRKRGQTLSDAPNN